jgi:hypothetical protein
VPQRPQELSQRVRLHFQFRDTGTLTRNTKKFNMHGIGGPVKMIAWLLAPTTWNMMNTNGFRRLSEGAVA